MTSNVGSQFIRDVEDVEAPEVKAQIDGALRAAFKPEFLNRIDDIIVFHKLGQKELRVVVEIQLQRLQKLVAERGYKLELTPAALDFLVTRGYDAAYGARPLKRAIQKWVQDPLASRIIAGDFKAGDHICAQPKADGSGLDFGTVLQNKADAGDGRAA
jgi:ATP-dependent Clp protease ATP-binding subunit ClpB